jgi:2'-5' RNA ligase
MLYAVSAWFDKTTEQRIRDIWQRFHEESIDSTFHLGPYRPHLTLALFTASKIQDVSKQLRTAHLPSNIQLQLSSIGFFNEPSVIFLNPALSQDLYRLHSSVYSSLISLGVELPRYYTPERWTPHISLSSPLATKKFLKGIEVVQTVPLPLVTTINRLGIIEEAAQRELEEIELPIY